MTLALGALAIVLATLVHEAGHGVAVLVRGGTVRRIGIGRGPAVWRGTRGETEWVVAPLPIGGRIDYTGVASPAARAVVAVGGSTANLAFGFVAALAGALAFGVEAIPHAAPGSGPVTFAAEVSWMWFRAVPDAVVELVRTGGARELRGGVLFLSSVLAERGVAGFVYATAALSSAWAALNLIPVPGLGTDGGHLLRALAEVVGRRGSAAG